MKVKIKQIYQFEGASSLPAYSTNGSAGMDLYAAIASPMIIKPHETALVPAGIAISLPYGYEAQIRSRSGLASKFGVIVLNSPGTIDSDYRGELKIIMINLGQKDFQLTPAMRIAQMVIAKYEVVSWELVDDLDETERGKNGFGSSGLK
ncbi:dUTP diphosphatase [Orientia tsutsugamushi]|uniref:Deoxyuridine 5'-triphosphate nucleotidohydrolase n=1 Tax=Orientia tsutsugamushi (strain Boryong) TaxID=357244 RepID=DUT_ORITB|nr:dUTP diphosphatase [Orientia tsutsugamushi]A5CD09.1 RecName: Full=Deoxyuridine 5'-triphosphate nucleotidohydrolase; Short=dUTPase; AltName: Full=dUTP pyrophosphatase [Orientia tsutsugamushi str. Boryong]CAM79646.1 deoxyuridine 5'-triphosphate nucleotidohydrolase [Orientia tsutsugamushi str. Boryong]